MARRWTRADLDSIKARVIRASDTVAPPPELVARTRKYRNAPCTVDNVQFDSRAEASRYLELRLRQKAGEISELVLQPVFDLHVCGVLVARYVGDFAYVENGERIVEDVKSAPTRTRLYVLKAKLMRAIHGITIREVRK
jgi:Protein of unknown function (DUF1064)